MTEMVEQTRDAAFTLSEAPGRLSRDVVTVDVPASAILDPGTVLGRLSGTGHYAPYDDRLHDGTETAVAILYARQANVGVAPIAVQAVVLNCFAEVRAAGLVWGDGVDDAAGLADLAARYIKARD
jgi:hypothetical protein